MKRYYLILTASGILAVSPNSVAHHTIRYEKIAIQIMLPKNVQTKNFRPENKYMHIIIAQKIFSMDWPWYAQFISL